MYYVETVQLGFYVELFVLGIEPKDLPLIGKHYLSFILRLLRAFDKRSVMIIYILFLLYFLVMHFSYNLPVWRKHMTTQNTLHFCTTSCQCDKSYKKRIPIDKNMSLRTICVNIFHRTNETSISDVWNWRRITVREYLLNCSQ